MLQFILVVIGVGCIFKAGFFQGQIELINMTARKHALGSSIKEQKKKILNADLIQKVDQK